MKHLACARSDFSIGESLLQTETLASKAKELGYKSVILTDTMSINSLTDFSAKAKKLDLKYVLGCRLRVYDDPTYRVPSKSSGEEVKENNFFCPKVYALGEKGAHSIMKLLTKGSSAEYFYYHSRVGLTDVLELEDVAFSTGDIFNLFHHPDAAEILQKLQARFGQDKTFVELCAIDTPLFHRLNEDAIALSKNLKAPTIVTYPALYENAGDGSSLEVLNAVATNTVMNSPWRSVQYVQDFYIKTPIDFAKQALTMGIKTGQKTAWLEGIQNLDKLVDMCNYSFEKKAPCLPKMAEDEFGELMKKCLAGWMARFSAPVLGYKPKAEELPKYKERLQYELTTLRNMGFSGYFLLVEDLVGWAKRNEVIVGPGRGSCFLPGHLVVCDKSGMTKAIEEFSPGDTVLAHDGSTQKVIATLEYDRDEEIIELEFSNGVRIECTKDHKFFTRNRGWVIAEELCGEDEFDDVSKLAKGIESASPPFA